MKSVIMEKGKGPWERPTPQGHRGTLSSLCEIALPLWDVMECKERQLTSKRVMAAQEIEGRYANLHTGTAGIA